MKKHLLLLSFTALGCINVFGADIERKFTFSKEKNKYHLMTSLTSQSTNISTDSSSTSVNANSDFSVTAQQVAGEYFLNGTFSLVGSYYFGLIIDIDAEVQGFDVGAQYYPFSNGTSKEVTFQGSSLSTSPEWAPYVYLGASTRDYQFSTVSLKFQGVELQAGSYWHFGENYFLRGNAFYQNHTNNNVRTLKTTGLSVGFGIKF